MKVTLAAIADYASISMGDKLNVLGVFDTLFAPNFPVQHPHMVFAVRLEFQYEDAGGRYPIHIRLENADRVRLMETPQGMLEGGQIPAGEFRSQNIIIELNNLRFEAPGTYWFVVRVADQEVATPFRVVERR